MFTLWYMFRYWHIPHFRPYCAAYNRTAVFILYMIIHQFLSLSCDNRFHRNTKVLSHSCVCYMVWCGIYIGIARLIAGIFGYQDGGSECLKGNGYRSVNILPAKGSNYPQCELMRYQYASHVWETWNSERRDFAERHPKLLLITSTIFNVICDG